jgi:predicted dienelactone hydrolase
LSGYRDWARNMPRFLAALMTLALSLFSTLTQAAGFSFIEVPADATGPLLRGIVWYPCDSSAAEIKSGPMGIPGVQDCATNGQDWPLVVISHGSGGSFFGHHDTAETLADAGFVVAAISHPGDNFQDLSRQAHLSAFAERPVDMRRLVDFMTQRWAQHARLSKDKIGFFGFSRGGYTGLVAAGAIPDFRLGFALCALRTGIPICDEIRHSDFPPPPISDPRIKAAVIVDPLSVFTVAGLKNVAIPIQLWASALGGDGVTPESVDAVRRGLPSPPQYHVAENAGHFAYLAPCSADQAQALPELCRDAPSFDRVEFHRQFNADVVSFFRANLH